MKGGFSSSADLKELIVQRSQVVQLDGRETFRPVRVDRSDHDPLPPGLTEHFDDAVPITHEGAAGWLAFDAAATGRGGHRQAWADMGG